MTTLIELKQTMTSLLETHKQLLILAQQKRTILVEGKVSELQHILSKESKILDKILELESLRGKQIEDYFVENGSSEQPLTMDQFINKMNNTELKEWFIKSTSELRDIIQELSQLNRSNQELIQMSLSYIQYSINIVMPKEPSIGYGKESAKRSAKFLDAQI